MAISLKPRLSDLVSLPFATFNISSNSSMESSSMVAVPDNTPLASKSILSYILAKVNLLPVRRYTGAMGFPVGVPMPVVNRTI